jgi:catechol 2,3-dioxygenase-like lactoylglutathione lyase family enzyme
MTSIHKHPPREDRESTPSGVTTKLEVIVIPVSDVDRSKEFYRSLGWRVDADYIRDEFRVVQLTPPGSACSIVIGRGITAAEPGSVDGTQLTVDNIALARSEFIARGVAVSEPFHDIGSGHVARYLPQTDARWIPGADPGRISYASFVSFRDPDGNGWILQEITTRLPGRTSSASPAPSQAQSAGSHCPNPATTQGVTT